MPAPGLMTVSEWKKNTSLMFRMRGPRLRAVDVALGKYHEEQSTPNLMQLLNAVEVYRTTREGGWENYRRNQGHIFEVLMSQLFNLSSNNEFVQTMAALPFFGIESWAFEGVCGQDLADAIAAERQHRLHQLLNGRTIQFKWKKLGWNETKNLAGLPMAIHGALPSGGDSNSVVSAISGAAGAVGNEFLSIVPIPKAELVGMVPILGLVYDALKTGWEWKKFAELVLDKGKFPGFLQACSGNAPDIRKAIEAVRDYLEKRMASQLAVASIQTATLGAKVGTFFADGGTASNVAISATKAALNTFLTLQFAYMEYQEMKAAQKLLSNPDASIFGVCPLLGCYMVTACDHSDLLNMFDGRRELSKYWMFEAEYYIRDINKLRDMSRKFMSESNIELVGPESAHNTVANKLRWMAHKAAATIGTVDHRKEVAAGRAVSSDAA